MRGLQRLRRGLLLPQAGVVSYGERPSMLLLTKVEKKTSHRLEKRNQGFSHKVGLGRAESGPTTCIFVLLDSGFRQDKVSRDQGVGA